MKNPIDLAAQAAAFADKYNMLPQGSTVLCALSGGADSVSYTHLTLPTNREV